MTFSPELLAAITEKRHRPLIKLEVAWNGADYQNETGFILDANGVESFDPFTGTLQPASATFTLDNLSGRYTAENTTSPIYAFIQGAFLDVRARLSLGYYYAGEEHFRQVGVFVVRSLTPQDQGRTAAMQLSEVSTRFADVPTFYGPVLNTPNADVFAALAQKAGLSSSGYATVGTAFGTAQFAASVGGKLAEEFGLLAIAEGGRVFVDNGGTLVFTDRATRDAELRTPILTLDKDTYPFDVSILKNTTSAVNRVTLEYEDRANALANETVWQITTPIRVPAAGTVTGSSVGTYYTPGQVRVSFSAQDQTRWVSYTPVVWGATGTAAGENPTAATANTTASGSGSAVVMVAGEPAARLALDGKLYYELTLGGTATGDGNRGSVVFRNMSSTPVFVTAFTLAGKPARLSSPYGVQADDRDGQELLGGQVLEQRLTNPYLPSVDEAYSRATDLLYFRSVRRVRVSLPSAPGLPIKAGEVFGVVDSSRGTTYLQQVVQVQWRFNAQVGYECSVEGLPALPGPLNLQLGDLIPVITDSVTQNNPEGPWYWAETGDPTKAALTWDANTYWGPLVEPTEPRDAVGAVSDSIVLTNLYALIWNQDSWDDGSVWA
jgi:hypothetical protein